MDASNSLITVSLDRWRTTLSLSVRAGDDAPPEATLLAVLTEEVDRLEQSASRFREDSELSSLNRSAGDWYEVSWYFVSVLTSGLDAAANTGGLVDPTLGRLVDGAGYRNWRDGRAPTEVEPIDTTPAEAANYQQIQIRPSGSSARVRIPTGCQLDLGAVAKAWLADQLAERVTHEWDVPVLANMGGDIRTMSKTEPWLVGSNPEIPGFEPAALLVPGSGLATSGQGKRRWSAPDGPAHHIIDPRTGQPAESPWWTVSVLADTAVAANCAATAALILGTHAPDWLHARALDAWLVAWDPAQPDPPAASTVGRWPVNCQVSVS